VRPAGLLFGVTPLASAPLGSLEDIATALANLAAAIPAPINDLVYLANPLDLAQLLILAPGLNAASLIAAPTLPAGHLIALDGSDFYSAESDAPEITVSEDATVVRRDDPVAITDAAGARGVPTSSLFQMALVAVRLVEDITFGMRRPGRVATMVAS